MGAPGLTHTEKVLERAWKRPFTVKSDFARSYADIVGMAASDGFITTKQAAGLYGNVWRISSKGLNHLNALKGIH